MTIAQQFIDWGHGHSASDKEMHTTSDRAAAAMARGRIIRSPAIDPQRSGSVERISEGFRGRLVRLAGSGIAVAATPLLIPFNGGNGLSGPEFGFTWVVRRVNVGPNSYAAGNYPAGINVIILLVGGPAPGAAGSAPVDSAFNVVSQTTQYPAEGTWGHGELTLMPGDVLFAIVTGLGAGVACTVGGQAEEYPSVGFTARGPM